MTAAKVIEEMDRLPPDEQAKVIRHALELARHRRLSADELGQLAERLAASNDPAEIIRLRSAMTRGFYGE
ncbi:MAG TPA: TilS substrate-binding domain-containing protein [Verrucomicrobiae bacterium]|nr:TilS substrate-binding domain-containing protein [Verrucomicrobiae bacterium]